jgi:hypothetical protein
MLFAFCFFYEEDAFCFHDNDRKKYRRFALVLMVLINQTDSFLTSISITLGFIRFFLLLLYIFKLKTQCLHYTLMLILYLMIFFNLLIFKI